MHRKNFDISRSESALLHLQWSFVYNLLIGKFHSEMYIFNLIKIESQDK